MTLKLVLCAILPLLPVTVTTYPPAVVAACACTAQFGEPAAPAAPPPQPIIMLIPAAAATIISRPRKSRRLATGNSRTHNPASASPLTRTFAAPPDDPHELPVLFAPACDDTVTTALALGAAALSTIVDGLTAQLGSSTAVPVTVQLSCTMPVNPFAAVANTVTVLPVVEPAVNLSDPGLVPIV